MVVWWLVIVAIPLLEVAHWILALRLPPLVRALAVPRQLPASILHGLLVIFALSQVGGFVGTAVAPIPQAPAWFYALLILFLAVEILSFVVWALRHAFPRLTRFTGPRRRAAPVTRPLAQSKPQP
jgi:hypothetical protein